MNFRVGQRLYRLVYWSGTFTPCRRELEACTIKKVNEKTIFTTYCYGSLFKKDVVGTEWFTSRRLAYENALKIHKRKFNYNAKPLLKEIGYLKKKIAQLNKPVTLDVN